MAGFTPETAGVTTENDEHPYKSRIANYAGRTVMEHLILKSMGQALEREKSIGRVFVYTGVLWLKNIELANTVNIGFLSVDGTVHSFDRKWWAARGRDRIERTVLDPIARYEHQAGDGYITVDQATGEVYQAYQTDEPHKLYKRRLQVRDWSRDVRAAADSGKTGSLQYATVEGTTTIDYAMDGVHLITTLDNQASSSLEAALAKFPDIPAQDITPILDNQASPAS